MYNKMIVKDFLRAKLSVIITEKLKLLESAMQLKRIKVEKRMLIDKID